MTPLAHLVTAFFRQNLVVEKGVSKNTIASYSYAFKFLCGYVSGRLGKSPSDLSLEDLDVPMVRDFLEHLERHGGDTARTPKHPRSPVPSSPESGQDGGP